jgi:hypothetical protein
LRTDGVSDAALARLRDALTTVKTGTVCELLHHSQEVAVGITIFTRR